MFGNPVEELAMARKASQEVQRQWRDRLGRFSRSTLSVAAFCRREQVTAASVQDRDGAKLVFAETHEPRLEKVWADGGDRGALVDWTQTHCRWELEIVPRPSDQKGFAVLPRRWVVERTFGWLNRYRLLSKDYEATFESSTADIQIALSHLMVRRLTRPPKPTYEHEHLITQCA